MFTKSRIQVCKHYTPITRDQILCTLLMYTFQNHLILRDMSKFNYVRDKTYTIQSPYTDPPCVYSTQEKDFPKVLDDLFFIVYEIDSYIFTSFVSCQREP